MKLLRAALGNTIIMTIVFLALFRIAAPYLLWGLEAVLSALDKVDG